MGEGEVGVEGKKAGEDDDDNADDDEDGLLLWTEQFRRVGFLV